MVLLQHINYQYRVELLFVDYSLLCLTTSVAGTQPDPQNQWHNPVPAEAGLEATSSESWRKYRKMSQWNSALWVDIRCLLLCCSLTRLQHHSPSCFDFIMFPPPPFLSSCGHQQKWYCRRQFAFIQLKCPVLHPALGARYIAVGRITAQTLESHTGNS